MLCTGQDISIPVVSRHLGFSDFCLDHTHNIENSFNEFLVFDNVGVAVGIYSIKACNSDVFESSTILYIH